ncbi:hypothetical protein SERLA73DRAFT_183299 [Serpula lacrymans var. lacrymans S7.3]|uniref:Uncharacterized protein n=2 Tax=Serpula lacrymans var. lacrymans TaxID=341189 RepID=F8PZM3_SERL3|nr:uncharacterized protein SERLADRAFT_470381 [Serpula lacrymans var. lacrymans S7.9]EGN98345.1 hypothetical protein SERLA73DRAFT_183299 [Serpula lacrymans var. lacrymans S7.3]EGO23907.1 hypothetical protein SERLADRAFT_470381 [Serpula lacrymans var. lacrymans S7.9]
MPEPPPAQDGTTLDLVDNNGLTPLKLAHTMKASPPPASLGPIHVYLGSPSRVIWRETKKQVVGKAVNGSAYEIQPFSLRSILKTILVPPYDVHPLDADFRSS